MPTEHISAKEFRITQGLSVKDVAEVKPKGVMNKWEQEYANLLYVLQRAGSIKSFRTMADKEKPLLQMTKNCKYTPDFIVTTNDEKTIVIEVKALGCRDRYSASILRFRISADLFPQFRFIMVTKKDGAWVTMYDVNKEAARLPLELC